MTHPSVVVCALFALSAAVSEPAVAGSKGARQADAKKALTQIKTVDDPQERAVLAATDLSERELGLPPGHREVLRALGGVGPRDCGAFLGATLQELAVPAIERRCKVPLPTLVERAQAEVPAKRAQLVAATCKITGVPAKELPSLDPWALLYTTLLLDLLAKDPGSGAAEKELVGLIAHACPVDAP